MLFARAVQPKLARILGRVVVRRQEVRARPGGDSSRVAEEEAVHASVNQSPPARAPSTVLPPIKPDHKMSKRQILLELGASGFEEVRSFDELPWQHLMFFAPRKPHAGRRR